MTQCLRRKCLAEFVEICPLLIYLLLCIHPLEDDQVCKTWRSNSLVISGQDRTETAGRKGLYWCWWCMVVEDILLFVIPSIFPACYRFCFDETLSGQYFRNSGNVWVGGGLRWGEWRASGDSHREWRLPLSLLSLGSVPRGHRVEVQKPGDEYSARGENDWGDDVSSHRGRLGSLHLFLCPS